MICKECKGPSASESKKYCADCWVQACWLAYHFECNRIRRELAVDISEPAEQTPPKKRSYSRGACRWCPKNKEKVAELQATVKSLRKQLGMTVTEVAEAKETKANQRTSDGRANAIRTHAREVATETGRPRVCCNCGYSKYVEVCHIKPVKAFPADAPLSEINDLGNLTHWCPNCHKDFDRGNTDIKVVSLRD